MTLMKLMFRWGKAIKILELEPENLPKQYFFGTNAAIQKLKFKKIRRELVG